MPTQVILLERVEKLGAMGDVVAVKPGYARNFLLPQAKALRATKENIAYFEAQKAHLQKANAEKKADAEKIAKKVEAAKVVIIRQASEGGQLYGSVTSRDIAEVLAAESKQPVRVNAVMNGMIAAYNEDQMRDLAAWFGAQTLLGEKARNRDTIEAGQKLYRAGNMAKGLPACAACHGPAGAGIPAQYPRIGGQFAEYIEAQLKAFRDESRANDPNKMMRMVAIKMTDAEIKAVSDYIAGLR